MPAQQRASRRRRPAAAAGGPTVSPPPKGGGLRALARPEISTICDAALDILRDVGMSGLPERFAAPLKQNGATVRNDGRLCFPRSMVEDALSRAPGRVALPGFTPEQDLTVGSGHVHIGTGGAAVQVPGSDGAFRDSTLNDLYALMRVLERSPNIHYGVRPVIARDLASPFELDVNTAFACMKATAKPIGVSFDQAAHVGPVVEMFDAALGQDGGFRRRPFCMGVIVHVVPPLTYAPEGCEILEACIRAGMIPQICSAGQAGATSPVTLAGALAQGLAESLAGLMLVDSISPGSPCIYALMPFVSDLRTGAMSGGGGEAAIASAAAAQLLDHLGLPSTVSAGMTDAKLADAQAGYEKGYTVALAAHAGADMINLSVGMLGSIMVAAPEMLVIDDDMCGAILRSVRGIEVEPDALDLEMIERVVTGEGHYLGEAQTLARMKTEYVYPKLADRQSVSDWVDDGEQSIWERAEARVKDILEGDAPGHLSRAAEEKIRSALPIRLEPDNI
ncbi:MAG: trimethylamine methyltransferase family protein [Pseudomonadota bacterium]